jgi:hypothetical protein
LAFTNFIQMLPMQLGATNKYFVLSLIIERFVDES